MNPRRMRYLLCWSMLVACLLAHSAVAQRPRHTNSIFLHLRMVRGAVSLVDFTVSPAKLKLPRAQRRSAAISYELVSSGGAVLWTESMNDPSIRRYEYEDPKEPGRIRVKPEVLETVEFTVRIPYFEGLERVEFYKTTVSPNGALAKAERHSVGTVVLTSADRRN